MNEQTTAETTARPTGETCLCREAARQLVGMLRLPASTRQHLNNSRVEFLRAIRSLIDARIDYLLSTREKGSRITVE